MMNQLVEDRVAEEGYSDEGEEEEEGAMYDSSNEEDDTMLLEHYDDDVGPTGAWRPPTGYNKVKIIMHATSEHG